MRIGIGRTKCREPCIPPREKTDTKEPIEMMARGDARNRRRIGLLIGVAALHAAMGFALTTNLGGELVNDVVRILAEIKPSYTE